jgi:hypothetical protein
LPIQTHAVLVVTAVTVAVAAPLLVASATLVATTWQSAAPLGAVYVPVCVTDPQLDSGTDHVTDGFVVPVTVAVNVAVAPAGRVADTGLTDTAACATLETALRPKTSSIRAIAIVEALFAFMAGSPLAGVRKDDRHMP